MKLLQVVVHYLFPAQVIHSRLLLASGREMASYKVENLGMESPAFLTFILINLSVRKWSFLGKKKIDRESPVFWCFHFFIHLKTRLKLQLEHLLCIWIDHKLPHSGTAEKYLFIASVWSLSLGTSLKMGLLTLALLSWAGSILAWKYKNYFSLTSANTHIQFLTCCGIRKCAEPFLWL